MEKRGSAETEIQRSKMKSGTYLELRRVSFDTAGRRDTLNSPHMSCTADNDELNKSALVFEAASASSRYMAIRPREVLSLTSGRLVLLASLAIPRRMTAFLDLHAFDCGQIRSLLCQMVSSRERYARAGS
jgi:hypothetical protein